MIFCVLDFVGLKNGKIIKAELTVPGCILRARILWPCEG